MNYGIPNPEYGPVVAPGFGDQPEWLCLGAVERLAQIQEGGTHRAPQKRKRRPYTREEKDRHNLLRRLARRAA